MKWPRLNSVNVTKTALNSLAELGKKADFFATFDSAIQQAQELHMGACVHYSDCAFYGGQPHTQTLR